MITSKLGKQSNKPPVFSDTFQYEYKGPCSVQSWLSRRNQKIKRIPAEWSYKVDEFKSRYSGAKVAVVFHVFFLDLIEEILELLVNIPVEFDLVISNSSGTKIADIVANRFSNLNFIELMTENHGRDILPLVHSVNSGLLDPYELIFKVHTKKSEWRNSNDEFEGDGSSWKKQLLSELIGSKDKVKEILSTFALDPTIGLITGDQSVLGDDFWGDNQPAAAHLLWRLQMHLEDRNLIFAAGSIYWCRAFVLKGLASLELVPDDFEPENGQDNGTTAHAIERLIGLITDEAGLRTIGSSAANYQAEWMKYDSKVPRKPCARVVPFYLPQFHRVEENDHWWGKGFTEWSNVTSAKPNFLGHNQPLLPSELGYYNLTDDSIRTEQWNLARTHGVSGFMYYYYWFAGKKLLNAPIESLLKSENETPFCIMWANENWTRSWDGGHQDVLLGQDYDEHSATEFLRDIAELLLDSRYFKIDGKPVIAVYKVSQIPNFVEISEQWRSLAKELGIRDILILGCDLGSEMYGVKGHPKLQGLDGLLEFPPHNNYWGVGELEGSLIDPAFEGRIISYKETERRAEWKLFKKTIEPWKYPGAMVNFDNTARRQLHSDVWFGSNPYTFRRWLAAAILALSSRAYSERVVFVNAWNEWAEGAVLEPSTRWGRTYLHAVESAVYQ